MSTIPKALAVFQTSLVSNISASDTSFNLKPQTDKAGNSLSGTYGVVVDKGKSNEEFMLISISSNVATVIKRGISPADPETEVTALKFSHRRNASVQFTDYTLLGILRQILNGETGFSLPNLIKYASGLVPVNDGDIASKYYVDLVAMGGSISQDKLSVPGIAGETWTGGGKVLYLKDDGKWWLADANDPATVENVILGMSRGSGVADGSITGGVLLIGLDENQSGATGGDDAYVSDTAGAVSTTAGTTSKKIGVFRSSTSFYFNPYYSSLVAVTTSAGAGDTGKIPKLNASGKLDNSFLSSTPNFKVFETFGDFDTRFDITNPTGTTFRYTYDGTGTDPLISSSTISIGDSLNIQGQNFNASNKGSFVVTGVGSNYFEISNPSGVAENDKTLGTGTLNKNWQKPAGLKAVIVEVQAAGAGACGVTSTGANADGSGAGGYGKKLILAANLASTETIVAGLGGAGGPSSCTGAANGGSSSFGSHVSATGGQVSSSGGVATGGDINIPGQNGGKAGGEHSGAGGNSVLGFGGVPVAGNSGGDSGVKYGGGASGANSSDSSWDFGGGRGAKGVVTVTEIFN